MKKILLVVLAVIMMFSIVACGGEVVETEPNETQKSTKSVTVNIVVRESEKGEDIYAINEYKYEGATVTVLAILEEAMFIEEDVEVVFDENGKLVEIGTIKADAAQLWLFSKASAPKGADYATPVDANIDEYSNIADGDTFVIYLS